MKLTIVSLLFGLFFMGCHFSKDTDIHGTWTSVNVVNKTGLNITEQIDFNEDGSYKFTMLLDEDSIVNELDGKYVLDKTNKILVMTANGQSFENKIIELEKERLKIKTPQGIEMIMKRTK